MLIQFEGLDELIKEFEELSSDKVVNKANTKIIQKCAKVVEKRLKPKTYRSRDSSRSGLKGRKTGQHAADNIEISKVKNTKGNKFITVGWDYDGDYGYMQWEEWGNTTRGPRHVLYPTMEDSTPEMNEITKKEYEKLLNELK